MYIYIIYINGKDVAAIVEKMKQVNRKHAEKD